MEKDSHFESVQEVQQSSLLPYMAIDSTAETV